MYMCMCGLGANTHLQRKDEGKHQVEHLQHLQYQGGDDATSYLPLT